jgi:hypothetical protein
VKQLVEFLVKHSLNARESATLLVVINVTFPVLNWGGFLAPRKRDLGVGHYPSVSEPHG